MIEDDDQDRDSWCTPRRLARDVGEWDLDPCSNDRSHIRATRTFSLERGEDGLRMARYISRSTRVWCNCPYSRGQVLKWVLAYRHTRFCFLLRWDPSTRWFQELWPCVGLIAQPHDRINFEPPAGVPSFTNIYPHALLFRRAEDATQRILDTCFIMERKAAT